MWPGCHLSHPGVAWGVVQPNTWGSILCAVERPLFAKYLGRKPLLVREAARLLVESRAGGGTKQDAGGCTDSHTIHDNCTYNITADV